uniref:3-hydroxyisobutyrate dehydrogenase n=1 Tax=Caligus clemensi TaxID=344056 RepID=C1C2H0_CALCM|nr:3-hydroxyisobutyrate dehydrogenase, mitochondrial precursor [Caligus clemensi]
MVNLRSILTVSRQLNYCLQTRAYSTSKPDVGFIGLGNMGFGMANNFLSKGFNVTAYDVNSSATNRLKSNGGVVASSPEGVFSASDILITMLPNNEIVTSIYSSSALGVARKGALFIDCSTISPSLSQKLAKSVSEKSDGSAFVDAPVSGGVNAANSGTLTIMVGAESDAVFSKAKSALDAVGRNVIHCGGVGTGQAVKLCNNMLLAISMIGTSEAMNLGENLGLDVKLLASILSTSTGRCWSVDTYNPVPGVMENVPSSNEYRGGFGTALMTKDLGLCQEAAKDSDSSTPLGSMAHQIYQTMCNNGDGDKDFSYSFQALSKKML